MVTVSASVNLPLHHKVQKFSSGTGSPAWSRKKGRKTVVVVVFVFFLAFCSAYFVLVLFAFVVFGLVFSVLSQEIGWEERLRSDLFCVEWDVRPPLNESVNL